MRTLLDLFSSPLFPLFFSAQENAISYYDSKADSDYVSTVRTAPALQPACLNKTLPHFTPRPPFTLQPPSSPPTLRSEACGLSVCVSEVAPLHGELM